MQRPHLDGKACADIAKELGATRRAFYAYKKKARNPAQSLQASGLKACMRPDDDRPGREVRTRRRLDMRMGKRGTVERRRNSSAIT
jgi:hypothetical protein